MWDAELARLATAYRVLRFDFRGYGRSELPPGRFSLVDDLRALLDLAEIEAAALVGLSGGSALALDFALTHPDRITRLVLAAPGIGGMPWSEDVQRFAAQEDRLLAAGSIEAAVELNLRLWVDGLGRGRDAVDPSVRAFVGEMQRRAFEVQLAAYERQHKPGPAERVEPPAVERLEEIRAPTLVVVGDADVADVLERADVLVRRIPGAQKAVVPGVAHMINLERPAAFHALLDDFLAGLDS